MVINKFIIIIIINLQRKFRRAAASCNCVEIESGKATEMKRRKKKIRRDKKRKRGKESSARRNFPELRARSTPFRNLQLSLARPPAHPGLSYLLKTTTINPEPRDPETK